MKACSIDRHCSETDTFFTFSFIEEAKKCGFKFEENKHLLAEGGALFKARASKALGREITVQNFLQQDLVGQRSFILVELI